MNNEMTGIRRPARAEWQNRKIVAVRGRMGFEQLATQWDQLILRMNQVRFFQHPDWYRALFDSALADPDEFLFVAVYDDPDIVGLFPLCRSEICVSLAQRSTPSAYATIHTWRWQIASSMTHMNGRG